MKNTLRAAAFIGAALAAPAESDAILQYGGDYSQPEVVSVGDRYTPERILSSTRLRIEECDGVAVEKGATADPKKPNRVSTYAAGAGAASCIPEAIAGVNRDLRAYAIKCSVAAAAAPTQEDPTRFEVSAGCEDEKGKSK